MLFQRRTIGLLVLCLVLVVSILFISAHLLTYRGLAATLNPTQVSIIETLTARPTSTPAPPSDGQSDDFAGEHLAVVCNTPAVPPFTIRVSILDPASGIMINLPQLVDIDVRTLYVRNSQGQLIPGARRVITLPNGFGIILAFASGPDTYTVTWGGGPYAATGSGDFAHLGFHCGFSLS